MIAIIVTYMVAVYLLGPELLSRWILGFVVLRKNVIQTKGEEITRALVWAALPLLFSLVWTYVWWSFRGYGSEVELQRAFSGLYSESFFLLHRQAVFDSFDTVWWMNVAVLWRLYLTTLSISVLLNVIVLHYGYLRQKRWGRLMTAVVARTTLPYISEWHLLFSKTLLPNASTELHADVLTKSGVLYQGRVQEKLLGPEGTLQTLTLAEPRRFLREQCLEQKKQDESAKSDSYWRPIPGNLFVIFGSDIANVNLRYVEPARAILQLSQEEKKILRALMDRLSEPEGNADSLRE